MRKSLEAIGLIALAVLVWITYQALAGAERLPDRIPTHFDMAGNANGWGSPAMLLLLPVIAAGLYLAINRDIPFPYGISLPGSHIERQILNPRQVYRRHRLPRPFRTPRHSPRPAEWMRS